MFRTSRRYSSNQWKCCQQVSHCNTFPDTSSIISWNDSLQLILNKQTSLIQYFSTPFEDCIKMILDATINNLRYKVDEEEIACLCYCLPILIRQIMYKRSGLKPNDIIQWLCEQIIVKFVLF